MTDPFLEALQRALGTAFLLDRELGGGGMSRVFVARDALLTRNVVVKVLSPELVQELSVERFEREITLAAALQHANIVPVFSSGVTTTGLPYYLMPFVDGTSVRARIDQGGALPIADTVSILTDVCRALAYAHARGVVHRDIKPDNVMISGGAAVVTDFGIAKAMSSARHVPGDEQLTRMGTSIGTPSYMAPEQGTGDPSTDHRADLYALGAMAYEMLSGSTPFGDRPAHALLVAHLTESPKDIAVARPDAPAALLRLVMQCLEKDPDARPQDASTALALLADAAKAMPTATSGVPGAQRAQRAAQSPSSPSRAPAVGLRTLALLGVGLVIAAGAGWFATRDKQTVPDGPDDSLLAVMPFTVRDASLEVWREGLVDVLSRNLDGAGTLRTVAASTSIARAPARADKATAITHGRALAAGIVLFGELSPIGADSVRARVTILNVRSENVRDVDVRGAIGRMDAMADTLSLRLLRELGVELGGAARASTIGTTQVSALKAYLRGLQFSRRSVTDSAMLAFRQAVSEDSTFSLAWRGVAAIYIRGGVESAAAPEAQLALERAMRYAKGRSPRDSMLLHTDSLRFALLRQPEVPNEPLADYPLMAKLIRALGEATERYPSDAEFWVEAGDAGFYFGPFVGLSDGEVLRSFTRAIALDSSILLPQLRAATLSQRLGDLQSASDHFRAVSRLSVDPRNAAFFAFQADLLDSASAARAKVQAVIDTAPAPFVAAMLRELSGYGASQPIATRLAAAQRERLASSTSPADSALLLSAFAFVEASAARVNESVVQRLTIGERAQLAQAGLWSTPKVAQDIRDALAGNQVLAVAGAGGILAEQKDTVSLATLVAGLERYDASPAAEARGTRAPYADLARAWMPLARGDTAATIRQLTALPTALCNFAPCAGYALARLLAAAKRDADAARVLDRWLPTGQLWLSGPAAMLLRAQVAERLGDRATARRWYGAVVARWGTGGDAARSAVASARAGLGRT